MKDQILQLENKVEELEKNPKLRDTQVQELHVESVALKETISRDYTTLATCTVLRNIKGNDKKFLEEKRRFAIISALFPDTLSFNSAQRVFSLATDSPRRMSDSSSSLSDSVSS